MEAYLDLKFHDEKVNSIYKDPTRRGRDRGKAPPAAPAAPMPDVSDGAEGGGSGAAAAGVGASGGSGGSAGAVALAGAAMPGGRIRLEGAMETAIAKAVEVEEEEKAKKRAYRGPKPEGGGCALM